LTTPPPKETVKKHSKTNLKKVGEKPTNF